MIRTGFLSLIGLLCFQLVFAQENGQENRTKKFNNDAKEFNDWYISVFAGANALQNTDLVSWGYGYGFNPGYDLQLQVTKEVTHAFSVGLNAQYGKTQQYAKASHFGQWNKWEGRTKYLGISLIGDLNLSNLLRRVDNKSDFVWAWHAYAGVGILKYKAERRATETPIPWQVIDDVKLNDRSVYAQVGTGLRRKLSKRFDIELKAMYVMTGDEEFDASGEPYPGYITLADIEEGRDDNMITLSLGLHWKLGKHNESLQWHDPMIAAAIPTIPAPCGDEDNDGVCDLYDKCPGTPEGWIVDGSGCPLDTDKDGVPDSIDECPTIPGPANNNGCPQSVIEVSIDSIITTLNDVIEGIEFDFDRATIRQVSYPKLDAAFNILDAHPNYKFYVEGHTDAAGSASYNQDLSERRAASVVRYLVNKGIPANQLVPVGKGKSDLKHPECDPTSNCQPWKNLENRRVIFKPYGTPVDGLEYKE